MKRPFIFLLILILPVTVRAQNEPKEATIKREVTLYNPYIPTVQNAAKRSFLPDMSDTMSITPEISYDINPKPFQPDYTISPIKAATLLSDPLAKLYKSYLNAGFGTYSTPLAELSISNTRSKKGVIGLYAKHLSTNGKLKLGNGRKVFAGYMNNEASLYARKFMQRNILEGSIDFNQYTRYAYGYDTSIVNYNPTNKEIKINYLNAGGKIDLYSLNTDSSKFSYDFGLKYNFFYQNSALWEHNYELEGYGAGEFKGFYAGSGLDIELYKMSPFLNGNLRNIVTVSPFVSKNNNNWSFKTGLTVVTETSQENLLANPVQDDYVTRLHIYPDLNISFSIMPSYINFFAGLNGRLENNYPLSIIGENPYLNTEGLLFNLPNTNHELVVQTGLKGLVGTTGNYLFKASYSIISDMILFKNYRYTLGSPPVYEYSNLFMPEADDAELFNIHGEMQTSYTDKISVLLAGNYYKYTMVSNDFAWNKPDWDAKIEFRYNLRNKILAGAELTAEGRRKALFLSGIALADEQMFELPMHLNLNLNAEYRYTKILSFWVRLNNISFNQYDEWLFYPSMRFVGMAGFTYSL